MTEPLDLWEATNRATAGGGPPQDVFRAYGIQDTAMQWVDEFIAVFGRGRFDDDALSFARAAMLIGLVSGIELGQARRAARIR